MTVSEDDNQVFNFVRQPYKLDGTLSPEIRITTFTNYDQPDVDGNLEIVTELNVVLESSDPTDLFYTESDATTLSLISDVLVDSCENCVDQ